MLSAIKNFSITFAIAAVIFAFAAFIIVGMVVDSFAETDDPGTNSEAITTGPGTEIIPPPDDIEGTSFNILLVGIDYQPEIFDNYSEEILAVLFPDLYPPNEDESGDDSELSLGAGFPGFRGLNGYNFGDKWVNSYAALSKLSLSTSGIRMMSPNLIRSAEAAANETEPPADQPDDTLSADMPSENQTAETQPPATEPPETQPPQPPATESPETQPPQPPATEPPETQPSQPPATEPPETQPPQPPATEPPETQPPQPPATEPPETQPPQPPATEPPETQPPQPPATEPPETQPPQPPVTEPPETQPPQPPVTEPPQPPVTQPPEDDNHDDFEPYFDYSEYRPINADMMILLCIDKERQKFTYTAFPENTLVNIEGRDYALNEVLGKFGIEFLKKKINSMTGLHVDKHVIVSIPQFADVVDLIDGVTFVVPCDMYYSDPGQDLLIDLRAGSKRLNGEQALSVLRFKEYTSPDHSRLRTALDLAQALMSKATSPLNLPKLPQLFEAASDMVMTDFTAEDFLGNLDLITAYQRYESEVVWYPGSNTTVGERQYFNPNEISALNIYKNFRRIYQ